MLTVIEETNGQFRFVFRDYFEYEDGKIRYEETFDRQTISDLVKDITNRLSRNEADGRPACAKSAKRQH